MNSPTIDCNFSALRNCIINYISIYQACLQCRSDSKATTNQRWTKLLRSFAIHYLYLKWTYFMGDWILSRLWPYSPLQRHSSCVTLSGEITFVKHFAKLIFGIFRQFHNENFSCSSILCFVNVFIALLLLLCIKISAMKKTLKSIHFIY